MLSAFSNCFKIPELKKKILFTLGIIIAYRIGCYIPTPGVNGAMLTEFFKNMSAKAGGGTIFNIMNMFSGGALQKLTVFALGIMPYISSSIIMQLLAIIIPMPTPVKMPPAIGWELVTYGYVPKSLSKKVPCARRERNRWWAPFT